MPLPPTNQTSPPPVEQSQNKVRFSNWFEFLHFLITDKEGKIITSILVVIVFVSIVLMRPKEIEIETGVGAIMIKREDKQNAVFLLSPNGGENTPWVKTGIRVNEGDEIKITATGRVNTEMKRIVAQAIRPEGDELTWASPSGLPPSTRDIHFMEQFNEAKVFPDPPDQTDVHYGFGMLLSAIEDSDGRRDRIYPYINDNRPIKFDAKTEGELVLTVNDIWLRGRQDIYAPELDIDSKEYYNYYLQMAEFNAALRDEDFSSWSDEKKDQEAKKQYQKRKKSWTTIVKKSNWNIWYEDNIGSFSVSISVEPGTGNLDRVKSLFGRDRLLPK